MVWIYSNNESLQFVPVLLRKSSEHDCRGVRTGVIVQLSTTSTTNDKSHSVPSAEFWLSWFSLTVHTTILNLLYVKAC